MFRPLAVALTIVATTLAVPLAGGPRNFLPDWTFTGSALTGFHPVGQADWRAENGEIVGTPKTAAGGWLLLPQSYQDVQFAATFRCRGACTAGVVLRAEKTADAMKGVYISLMGGERGAYAIKVDAQGTEVGRDRLRAANGAERIAPPPPPPPPAGSDQGRGGRGAAGGRGGGGGRLGMPGGIPSPFPEPASTDVRPDDWNTFEAIVDANIARSWLNGGSGGAGVADEEIGKFGPVALHVGGTGEVRFKDVAVKDLGRRLTPPESLSQRFRMQRIEDFYTGWSAAAGDFNHDGVMDVTSGHRYYLGPDFKESREIYLAQPYNPALTYSPAMVNFAFDYTGDGWDDVLISESRAPALYVNPRGESRRWDRYRVFPQVVSEAITFKDVDGDGKPDAVFVGSNVLQYVTPDPKNPTAPWTVHVVSEPGPWGFHGIGAGDINGDGRVDILHPYGWWEQPAKGTTQKLWTYHPVALGRMGPGGGGGAEMVVFDVNGDGRNDVVTSLSAHWWGLAWYEQKRDAAGAITFEPHIIMDDFSTKNAGDVTFSELHALTAADVDGDRIQDIVVGKRHWAHLDTYSDPDPNGPGVLYWYRTVRNPKAPGGAEFVPELIHNRSGVGSMVHTADLNKDGAVDIMAATSRGTFIFWGAGRNRRATK
jgi:Domain of Unknown Function (DUF1080)/FG-GAP-like repeat